MATALNEEKKERKAEIQKLVDALNEDLAFEYAAVIMYRTYASRARGPWRETLRGLFAGEIPEELGHAELLADKIVALGGEPTTRPQVVEQTADVREMLRNALEEEKATIERYLRHRAMAEELGEHGLVVDLDDLIRDETRHRDQLELTLSGEWS